MFAKMEEVNEKILCSEELVETLKKKETVEEVIEFYQSIDSTLTEDDILDYFCKMFNIEENYIDDEDVLEHICGGKNTPINKLLASTLGALTMTTSMGFGANVGAKGIDGVKNTPTSASQTVKSGFKKLGDSVKNKWNSLSKKQKIAVISSLSAAAVATVGLSVYGVVKYHKGRNIPKPGEKQPEPKPTDPTPSSPRINTPTNPADPIADPTPPISSPTNPTETTTTKDDFDYLKKETPKRAKTTEDISVKRSGFFEKTTKASNPTNPTPSDPRTNNPTITDVSSKQKLNSPDEKETPKRAKTTDDIPVKKYKLFDDIKAELQNDVLKIEKNVKENIVLLNDKHNKVLSSIQNYSEESGPMTLFGAYKDTLKGMGMNDTAAKDLRSRMTAPGTGVSTAKTILSDAYKLYANQEIENENTKLEDAKKKIDADLKAFEKSIRPIHSKESVDWKSAKIDPNSEFGKGVESGNLLRNAFNEYSSKTENKKSGPAMAEYMKHELIKRDSDLVKDENQDKLAQLVSDAKNQLSTDISTRKDFETRLKGVMDDLTKLDIVGAIKRRGDEQSGRNEENRRNAIINAHLGEEEETNEPNNNSNKPLSNNEKTTEPLSNTVNLTSSISTSATGTDEITKDENAVKAYDDNQELLKQIFKNGGIKLKKVDKQKQDEQNLANAMWINRQDTDSSDDEDNMSDDSDWD